MRAWIGIGLVVLLGPVFVGCGEKPSSAFNSVASSISEGGPRGDEDPLVRWHSEDRGMATSADDFQSLSPPPEEVENAAEGSAEIDGTDDAPRTRQELDDYIARFKTETKWTYGGRSDGLPIGSWESDDGDRCPARFAKDGEVEVGFIWQKGAGSLAKGIYAISDSGRIAYVARCDGVSLAGWFRVDGAAIYGPRGPLPRVNYVRVKNSD